MALRNDRPLNETTRNGVAFDCFPFADFFPMDFCGDSEASTAIGVGPVAVSAEFRSVATGKLSPLPPLKNAKLSLRTYS